MKRIILVTGGGGYIGSQLIRDFAQDAAFQDCVIRIYDNLQRDNHHVLLHLPQAGQYQFVEGDILDRVTLAEAMRDVWAVVHLAAVVKTPISFDHPEWTEQVNHWGTATVVDQAVEAGVERFVYACSASVYGPGGVFREADLCNPVAPYSISKLRGEQTVMGPGRQRGLATTSLRLGTVFGEAPGVRFEAVINRMGYLAGIGKSVVVHGDGEQRRPLLHVRDASAAIRFCLQNSETEDQIFNVVATNPTISELVTMLQAIVPDASVRYTNQNPLTALSFAVDGGRLEQLGYKPSRTVESGLSEIVSGLGAVQPMQSAQQPLNF